MCPSACCASEQLARWHLFAEKGFHTKVFGEGGHKKGFLVAFPVFDAFEIDIFIFKRHQLVHAVDRRLTTDRFNRAFHFAGCSGVLSCNPSRQLPELRALPLPCPRREKALLFRDSKKNWII